MSEETSNMEGRSLKDTIPVLIELVKSLSADVKSIQEELHDLRGQTKKDSLDEYVVKKELQTEEEQLNSLKDNQADCKGDILTDTKLITEGGTFVEAKMNWLINRGNLARDTKLSAYTKKLQKLQYLGSAATSGEHQMLRSLTREPNVLGDEVGHNKLRKFEMDVKAHLDTMKISEENRFSFMISHVGESDKRALMELQTAWRLYVKKSEETNIGFLDFTDAMMILEYKHRVKEDIDQLLDEMVSGRLSKIWKDATGWVEAMKNHLNKFDDSYPEPGERLRIIMKACKSSKYIYLKLKDMGYSKIDVKEISSVDVQNALNEIEDVARTLCEVEEGQAEKRKSIDQTKNFREGDSKYRNNSYKKNLNNFSKPAPRKGYGKNINPNIVCDACLVKGHHAYSEECREYSNKGTESWNSTVRKNKEARRSVRGSAGK